MFQVPEVALTANRAKYTNVNRRGGDKAAMNRAHSKRWREVRGSLWARAAYAVVWHFLAPALGARRERAGELPVTSGQQSVISAQGQAACAMSSRVPAGLGHRRNGRETMGNHNEFAARR